MAIGKPKFPKILTHSGNSVGVMVSPHFSSLFLYKVEKELQINFLNYQSSYCRSFFVYRKIPKIHLTFRRHIF